MHMQQRCVCKDAKSLHRKKEWLLIQQMEIMKMQDIGSMALLLAHYFRVSLRNFSDVEQ